MEELPTAFGKYFLSERIATGGMAEIYLAKLIGPGGFEKQLVIKQISPELSAKPEFVDLFVTEAKTLVSLSHGNIVPIYELGVIDETYFIAMEYVDGPTLAELVAALQRAGERMSPATAAFIAAELADGLDYAHRKGDGVIHRDVSPRNVICSREGEVKVVDFGIAVVSGARQDGALRAGSAPYMSPEQVRGEPLDRQSDLFSAGVLLWELLTGRTLFARETAEDTLEAVLHADVPPPSSVAPDVPAALDVICRRALARERSERFATAAELQAALGRYLYSLDTPQTAAAVTALIARVCPPHARRERATTEVEESTGGGREAAYSTRRFERPSAEVAAVAPKGRRAATVQTFATSVEFATVLKNATPHMPLRAIREPAAAAAQPSVQPAPATPAPHRPRGAIAVVVVAVVAATGGALVLTRDRAGRAVADPAVTRDAGVAAVVAPAVHPSADAAPPIASRPTEPAPTVADAGAAPPTRASARVRADAGAPAAPRLEKGRLQVGANPWADVYLDGALLGQAPGEFAVAAGAHAVELRFREQRRRFDIAVTADQTTTIDLVDFTAP